MARATRVLLKTVFYTAILLTILVMILLENSRIETTENGVDKRLHIPTGGSRSIAINLFSGTGSDVSIPGFLDGPIVKIDKHGKWDATWYCLDRVGQSSGSGTTLSIRCGSETKSFSLLPPASPDAVAAMPEKVIVLSDLEGNIAFLENALRQLNIVDDAGAWQFEKNRLVILGDSVDRGRDVYAVLWRLYNLSQQAQAAGGAVHLLLGNHEQYILRGNISRMNPEHLYALQQMGGYSEGFASDTLIGAWLREQPVIVKLGSAVFVHGGIHVDVAKAGHTIEQLNASMKAYWNRNSADAGKSSLLDSVLDQRGVTQYRGYVMPLEEYYPQATQADVETVLKHFSASHIVVAHTLVDKVTPLYKNKVYAVDVNTNEARPEVLSFENGIPKIVNLGVARNLQEPGKAAVRNFSLTDSQDIEILRQWIRHSYALSQLPQPY